MEEMHLYHKIKDYTLEKAEFKKSVTRVDNDLTAFKKTLSLKADEGDLTRLIK